MGGGDVREEGGCAQESDGKLGATGEEICAAGWVY